MQSIFAMLASKIPTAARCAAALGMTRQAFAQAKQRGALSPLYTVRAALIVGIDPAAAILAAVAATLPAAERAALSTPAPRQSEIDDCIPNTLYYVKSDTDAKSNDVCVKNFTVIDSQSAENPGPYDDQKKATVHSLLSPDRSDAIDLIKWVLAVAKLPADSPRFTHYVSRWRVPEKITSAKAAGYFESTVANCPPIDPSWVRYVPAALAEYEAFTSGTILPPIINKPGAACHMTRPGEKLYKSA